jgi:hypothetical protein
MGARTIHLKGLPDVRQFNELSAITSWKRPRELNIERVGHQSRQEFSIAAMTIPPFQLPSPVSSLTEEASSERFQAVIPGADH